MVGGDGGGVHVNGASKRGERIFVFGSHHHHMMMNDMSSTTVTTTTAAITSTTTALSENDHQQKQQQQQQEQQVELTKKERGRLKKLRKRLQQKPNKHQLVVEEQQRCPPETITFDSLLSLSVVVSQCQKEKSGLLTSQEWMEFKRLVTNDERTLRSIGPSIRLRKDIRSPVVQITNASMQGLHGEGSDVFTEGVHHRDLLAYVIHKKSHEKYQQQHQQQQHQQQQSQEGYQQQSELSEGQPSLSNKKKKKKKRSRSTTNSEHLSQDNTNEISNPIFSTSIPSWATIHNPGCIEHVVVLELHVTEPNLMETGRQVQQLVTTASLQKRSSLFMQQTQWFQGPTPRSISDSLMLWPVRKDRDGGCHHPSKRIHEGIHTTSREELVQALQSLTLTRTQLIQEGYPERITYNEIRPPQPTPTIIPAVTSYPQPASIPLEQAQTFVSQHGFVVKNPKQDTTTRSNDESLQNNLLYVATSSELQQEIPHPHPRIFGLDCEMVQTGLGAELARITLVEWIDGTATNMKSNEEFPCPMNDDSNVITTKTVFDTLVKPYSTILNYVTDHSGMTPQILDGCIIRLEQVQLALTMILKPNDLLIGHSLENDLHACRYCHETVVDTAVVFRRRSSSRRHHQHNGCKYSLKHLAAVLLRRNIQNGSHHCSHQDASTALELAIGRAIQGPSFGILDDLDPWSVLESLPPESTTVCMGPAQWLSNYVTTHPNAIHAITYDTTSDIERAMKAWLTTHRRKANLIWAYITIGNKENSWENVQSLAVRIDCDSLHGFDGSTL